jgi:hypothetical protein
MIVNKKEKGRKRERDWDNVRMGMGRKEKKGKL